MTQNIVMDEFEWDAELEASDFQPNIPAGYAPMKEESEKPEVVTEE